MKKLIKAMIAYFEAGADFYTTARAYVRAKDMTTRAGGTHNNRGGGVCG